MKTRIFSISLSFLLLLSCSIMNSNTIATPTYTPKWYSGSFDTGEYYIHHLPDQEFTGFDNVYPTLYVFCENYRLRIVLTEGYAVTQGMFEYWLDNEEPISYPQSGGLGVEDFAEIPNASDFLNSMLEHSTLHFVFTDRNSKSHEFTYTLLDLENAVRPIKETCGIP